MWFESMNAAVLRWLRAVAAITLALAGTGCSFAFSRGPSGRTYDATSGEKAKKCSTSLAPPILDTVLVATHFASGAWGLTQPKETFLRSDELRTGVIVADMVLAAVHLTSAIYGYTSASACRGDRAPESGTDAPGPDVSEGPTSASPVRAASGVEGNTNPDLVAHPEVLGTRGSRRTSPARARRRFPCW